MRVAGDKSTGSTSGEGDSGCGVQLLSQLLQQEPQPPGPPPSSSSSSESDEGGPSGAGVWIKGEWWPYQDDGSDFNDGE